MVLHAVSHGRLSRYPLQFLGLIRRSVPSSDNAREKEKENNTPENKRSSFFLECNFSTLPHVGLLFEILQAAISPILIITVFIRPFRLQYTVCTRITILEIISGSTSTSSNYQSWG